MVGDGNRDALPLVERAPEPGYAAITDGKWRCEGPYRTIHLAAVEATYRGTGLADRLIGFAESLARAQGAVALRVDTHRHNKAMKALLLRRGFVYRGNVRCDEPKRDPRRQAFEKLLGKDET